MHVFQCKAKSGQIVPASSSKEQLFKKLLDHYEKAGTTFTITIEQNLPNINDGQEKLYKAFVLKAAEHFGTDFGDMQETLKPFWPDEHFHYPSPKPVQRWDTKDLNSFIDKASAYLADFGFHF